MVYDDSVRLGDHEQILVPFSIAFPSGNEAQPSTNTWTHDSRFDSTGGAPLPPSVNVVYFGFSHHFECFVAYQINVSVSTPGIEVAIDGLHGEGGPHLQYEPLPPLRDTSIEHHRLKCSAKVQNEFLLPEDLRPHGFKERAKAVFQSDYYPTFQYEISLSVPKAIYLGERIRFRCKIKPDLQNSTAPTIPDVTLYGLQAQLRANTLCRSEQGWISCYESHGSEDVLQLESRKDPVPFNKADNWVKDLETQVVEGNFCSSFSTFNIARSYSLKLHLCIGCAAKSTNLEHRVQVILHPPRWQGGTASSEAIGHAGPSVNQAVPIVEDLGDAGLTVPVPEYEEPPSYDQIEGNAGPVGDVQGEGKC